MSVQANEQGFTILELLLAVSISSILTTVLLAVSLTFFGDVVRNNEAAELSIETYYSMRSMIEDIRLADGVSVINVIADPNQPVGGWATSDPNNILIIKSPVVDSSNNVIYDSDTGYPYENETIYFVSNNHLYKRTLKNTSAAGNVAKTSCPQALATAACPVDKDYHQHIDDISFAFYDNTNTSTTDPLLARSVKVNLTSSRQAFGKTISFTNTLQTTLRNY